MTLEIYDATQLDRISLRLFDLAAKLRGMALRSREQQIAELPLHDKKALEWLQKLEDWAAKSDRDLELAIVKNRGTRRAARAK